MFSINTFFLFSILGYIYEFFLHCIEHNLKKQILFGPWMPIYGIGLLLTDKIDDLLRKKYTGWKKILRCFLISIIVLTIIEQLGGLLIEKLFCQTFWNYESIPLSIGPYINVFVSLIWGFFAMILEYILFPLLTPFIKKIPKWVSLLLLILLLIDIIFSVKNNLCLFNKSLTFMRFIS